MMERSGIQKKVYFMIDVDIRKIIKASNTPIAS
jgi:hypothetical protein